VLFFLPMQASKNNTTPGPGSIVKSSLRAIVTYDPEELTFTKTFKPTRFQRLKYWIHLQQYPGLNYRDIAKILDRMHVLRPTIVSCSFYNVSTKKVSGVSLYQAIRCGDKSVVESLLAEYSSVVARIISAGLYFTDFHFRNFIAHKNQIYALDLDNYRYSIWCTLKVKRIQKEAGRKQIQKAIEKLYQRLEIDGDAANLRRLRPIVEKFDIISFIRSQLNLA
jgi:hypothetical protein